MIGLALTQPEREQIARDLEGTICTDECLVENYPHRKVVEILNAAAEQGVVRCDGCNYWTRNVNRQGECQDCEES